MYIRDELESLSDSELKKRLKQSEYRVEKYSNAQLAKKVSLNSCYGSLGNVYSRFFDIRQAEAVTLSGQLAIRWIEKDLNLYLNKLLCTDDFDYVIAIDTDSVYLNMGPLVKSITKLEKKSKVETAKFLDTLCSKKIEPYIEKSYQNLANYLGAFKQKMVMKRECIADKGLWTAKKRYILSVYNNEGVEYINPELKVMGIECVRSSTPLVCRGKIKEALKIIMSGNEDQLKDFVSEFEREFKTLNPSDVAFPRGVNNITKYSDSNSLYKKGTPIHVRGSILYNELIKDYELSTKFNLIRDGDKIKFVYLKEPNITGGNVISFLDIIPEQFKLEDVINYDLQFTKTFLDPLQVVVNAVGWKLKSISAPQSIFG